jgi:hypothetical protein
VLNQHQDKAAQGVSAPSLPKPQTCGLWLLLQKSSSIGKRRDHVNSSDIY